MAGDSELKAMETVFDALKSLGGDEQQRVLNWVASKLGLEWPMTAAREVDEVPPGDGGVGSLTSGLGSIKQFVRTKQPFEDVLRVTTLAHYLTEAKNQPTFKTADIAQARAEAAMSTFNISRAVSNAHRAGLLTNAGKRGLLQITGDGEAVVDALPSRDAVKEVRAKRARRKARRRKPAAKKRTSKQ